MSSKRESWGREYEKLSTVMATTSEVFRQVVSDEHGPH